MQTLKPYKSQFYILIMVVLAIGWFTRCAHPVAPTGGDQDKTPPVVLRTVPENFTTQFEENKIELEFDEFIQLKDASKQIFTSPPMVEKPEYVVRGKNLIIQLKEELRDDMTYVINFGTALVDLNEGNPLLGYSYVFSTGKFIDSLSISGQVVNAFDLKPVESILLSVYTANQDTVALDSMPLKVPPLSATRTRADGNFQLTNLPAGEYLVFALEDLNSNYYYDIPNEKIAFLDSLIVPEYINTRPDTLSFKDSTMHDHTASKEPKNPITLYLFEEFDSTQRILSSSMLDNGSLQFAFRLPANDFMVLPLDFPGDEPWNVIEYNQTKDTITYWPLDVERDTFRLQLSLEERIWDTVKMVRKSQDRGGLLRKKKGENQALQFRLNTRAGVLAPGKDLMMTFPEPLKSFDYSGFEIRSEKDTVNPEVQMADSIMRKFIIKYDWIENQRYELAIPDSVMTGISGASNDSIIMVFRTKPLSNYGSFVMNYLVGENMPDLIIELLTDKDVVLQRNTISSSQKVVYQYLNTGTYRLKVIYDQNGNGKWDTGNYNRKELPEKVSYYDKTITIRENWEIQEEWSISQ